MNPYTGEIFNNVLDEEAKKKKLQKLTTNEAKALKEHDEKDRPLVWYMGKHILNRGLRGKAKRIAQQAYIKGWEDCDARPVKNV